MLIIYEFYNVLPGVSTTVNTGPEPSQGLTA